MNRIDYDELLKRLTGVQKEIWSHSSRDLNSWRSVDVDTDYTCTWNHTSNSFLQDKPSYLSDEDKIAYAINEWARNSSVNKDCSFSYNPAKKTNYKPKAEIKESEILQLLINE